MQTAQMLHLHVINFTTFIKRVYNLKRYCNINAKNKIIRIKLIKNKIINK